MATQQHLAIVATFFTAACFTASSPSPAESRGIIAAFIDTVFAQDSAWLAATGGLCLGLRWDRSRYVYSDPDPGILEHYSTRTTPVRAFSDCCSQEDYALRCHNPDSARSYGHLRIDTWPLRGNAPGVMRLSGHWMRIGFRCNVLAIDFFATRRAGVAPIDSVWVACHST